MAFLVFFFSLSSPFSLVGKATYLLPPGTFALGALVLRQEMGPPWFPVVVAHCIRRGHMSHLYSACVTGSWEASVST